MPLTMARVYDGEYEHWQNAEDPLEFTASYLGEPRSHMIEFAAQTALDVAQAYMT